MFEIRVVCFLLVNVTCLLFVTADDVAAQIRMNEIQVIGTHNSYHLAPHPTVMRLIAQRQESLAQSLDYTHRPLSEQFGQLGIRQIELDIYADPTGGLYAKPLMAKQVADVRYDPKGALQRPGLKVLHIQDIDYRTTVLTLVDALQQVRSWSRENPQHVPILIMLEVKQQPIGNEFTRPHPFGQSEFNMIDREILSVFEPTDILKPDDVRGDDESLRSAVTQRGWPYLNDVRGKVMFALDNEGVVRDSYLLGHRALRGRLLFVSVDESDDAAAFMKLNDPIEDFQKIQDAVRKGFLVRTRADSGTRQARFNDPTQAEKAFASGAQFISTDYPEPDHRFSDYRVVFPRSIVARGNVLNGDAAWHAQEFDLSRERPAVKSQLSD
ncbi:MAG: phosphatidylinositol-specific phospholipase C1-like protein [Pirellulaceae bacterium]|nr:phosphatidylinositol-specific phospholipase C1-like protein [Pirellulaceae bacterium]